MIDVSIYEPNMDKKSLELMKRALHGQELVFKAATEALEEENRKLKNELRKASERVDKIARIESAAEIRLQREKTRRLLKAFEDFAKEKKDGNT